MSLRTLETRVGVSHKLIQPPSQSNSIRVMLFPHPNLPLVGEGTRLIVVQLMVIGLQLQATLLMPVEVSVV